MDEITAEYTVQNIAPSADLRIRPKVSVGCKTDLGRVRENNEDKYEFFIPEDDATIAARGLVFIVCDGMGGHEAGQIASELTTKTFIDVYLNHPSDSAEEAARCAVLAANRFVLDVARAVPSRRGMGTTLSAIMVIQDKALLAHVGDSRIYRLRDGDIKMLTSDHTWVEESIRMGTLTKEEAEQHPYRHVLTRAIGTEHDVNPDIFWDTVEVDDIYLLCSDGINNHVSDEALRDIMATSPPSGCAWKVVGQALTGGGSDNATVIVFRVDDLVAVGQP